MIPAWNMAGVIPPIRPGQPGHSSDRSPYLAALSTVVDRFGFSQDRLSILSGLLSYRAALHALGICSGFQWLDGSFLQDVEAHESRSPADVDVVTYLYLPPGETQITLNTKAGQLFHHNHVKATYHVDAYLSILGNPLDQHAIKRNAYWYSMWSHRRDGLWKGFVQVDLSPTEDALAQAVLASKMSGGPQP